MEVEMSDHVVNNNVVSLFNYIKELSKMRKKLVTNIAEHQWYTPLSEFEYDEDNINVFYRDSISSDSDDDYTDDSSLILSIGKPDFYDPPKLPQSLYFWVVEGWEDYNKEFDFLKSDFVYNKERNIERDVKFTDNKQLVLEYEKWSKERDEWAKNQRAISKTRIYFSELYRLYNELQRDSENIELIVANGIIKDSHNKKVNHPVLTKRVNLNFDSVKNVIRIDDTDTEPQLYTDIFQDIKDINSNVIKKFQQSVDENFIHPLDRVSNSTFLESLVRELSVNSKYYDNDLIEKKSNIRLSITNSPVLIVRKRLDGTIKVIEQIIEDIEQGSEVPNPILDIVSGGMSDIDNSIEEESISEQLASVGGESVDILLSKEANREQLEIAKRIENYNAVLVQGPPGTGKTHTIANLMGHFLAQGKTVLVTSHTNKALRVLKEKVVPGLQNLCVSVIEDSNKDMERSVDGITEYMSNYNVHEVKNSMDSLHSERISIINELADIRNNIYDLINKENDIFVVEDQEYTPSSAAKYVVENRDRLDIIPGEIAIGKSLTLDYSELVDLYRSNALISEKDDLELSISLPDPEYCLSEDDFNKAIKNLEINNALISEINDNYSWSISEEVRRGMINLSKEDFHMSIPNVTSVDAESFKTFLKTIKPLDEWNVNAALDGKNGGYYKERWLELIEKIDGTIKLSEDNDRISFAKDIRIGQDLTGNAVEVQVNKLREILHSKSKISKIQLLLNKELSVCYEMITINGEKISTVEDCDIILSNLKLNESRLTCARHWDELIGKYDTRFFDLDEHRPEDIASRWAPVVLDSLNWYEKNVENLKKYLYHLNIPYEEIFKTELTDSKQDILNKTIETVHNDLVPICDLIIAFNEVIAINGTLDSAIEYLERGQRIDSILCQNLVINIKNKDTYNYGASLHQLVSMHEKYRLKDNRQDLLDKLSKVAPLWSNLIEHREGIHGEPNVPDNIIEAWKWKQLDMELELITSKSFNSLQVKSRQLSKAYRDITAKYAEKSAWYHLLSRASGNRDMQQALHGWKQTVKKIGKGTGKRAPALRAKARELMSECQSAVPAWIMPINKALETLNPKENKFDVVIIDEASQSDVSSLAVLYLANKAIIVGDDKQVSPGGVGVNVDKINDLQDMYIKGVIPNSHLYDVSTSIYDIAATTFQPLMLREHFRCVPEIIGYSNMLSYDYKIKPLRDVSQISITPSVVHHKVKHGERLDDKTNRVEANEIVSLIKSCIKQPEYDGKTFGIISLVGAEQVKLIQQIIEQEIEPRVIQERKILCGTPANFQGDERDVVFLSMVYSPEDTGPLRMVTDGTNDMTKKRYNVAASRAKDQLWIVTSLDSALDLKSGDIRKGLIEYSMDPTHIDIRNKEIESKSDSPFESEVVKRLVDRDYEVIQQWPVGSYRLDMVVRDGDNLIAIECDGERYHSGEEKIREDMERQTILERLGWRFIRIRGSEYYMDKDKAIDRVIFDLSEAEVYPSLSLKSSTENDNDNNDLLSSVLEDSRIILDEFEEKHIIKSDKAVEYALSN